MNPDIRISLLDPEDQRSIKTIAQWYFEEWATPVDKTVEKLRNLSNADSVFHLVLWVEDQIAATGGLSNVANLPEVQERFRKYKPWVALLYTHKDHRKKGYGGMLLNEIETRAKKHGLAKIYLYTFTAESLYRKRGWKVFDRVEYKGHDTAVMEKVL